MSEGDPPRPVTIAGPVRRVGGKRPPAVPSAPASALSSWEEQILHLIAAGRSASETGADLGISLPTIGRHLLSIRGKLGVRSTREAVHRWGRSAKPQTPST